MNNITIMADVNSDIPNDIVSKMNIKIIPQYYRFENEKIIYGDDINLTSSEFFNRLSKGDKSFSMGCNPVKIMEMFEKEIRDGKEIICIMFSSLLSGSYNTTLMVKEELLETYPNARINIIDSKSASFGQGLITYKAALLNDQGKTAEEILTSIDRYISICSAEFVVDDLSFLSRGGRLSSTSAKIGTVLNVKPVLHITNDGKISSREKARGHKKSLNIILNNMVNNITDTSTIGIVHTNYEEGAINLSKRINELKFIKEHIITEINLTIGTHTGPKTLGLCYFGKNIK